MIQIYPDDGLLFMLDRIADGVGSGLYFRLYENNITPGHSDTLATYTLSATSWGRQAVLLAAYTLKQVFTNIGQIQAPNITFTNTSGSTKTVYGYVVEDISETYLIAAARFDAAPVTVLAGGTVVVTPTFANLSNL